MAPAPMRESSTEWLGWYFSAEDERLRNGDGRKIKVGITHTVKGPPIPCVNGLHASPTVLKALTYAPGPILWRVRLSGTRVDQGGQSFATEHTYLARIDATDILRAFARRCALDVIHLWDAPSIVREYLDTGAEDLRDAAWDAARAATWDATWDAARAATWAATWAAARVATWDAAWAAARNAASAAVRDATRDAAGDATWDAAWAAASAAAWDATWDAAKRAQEQRLDSMVIEALAKQEAAIAAAEGRSDG